MANTVGENRGKYNCSPSQTQKAKPAESSAADRIWQERVDMGFSNAHSLVTSMPIASAEERKAY